MVDPGGGEPLKTALNVSTALILPIAVGSAEGAGLKLKVEPLETILTEQEGGCESVHPPRFAITRSTYVGSAFEAGRSAIGTGSHCA
jgi:hypothetical protein